MRIVDTRGEKCPKPIIETKKALRESAAGETFRVLTDSKTSFSNVSRFLSDNNIKYSVSEEGGIWTFEVTNEAVASTLTDPESYCEPDKSGSSDNGYAVAITSEFMGSGDDVLGKKLMKSFFVALSVLDELPAVVVFYNSGVKLVTGDSEVIDILHEIESKGVGIISCSTCVDHFELDNSVDVGKTGDMYTIMQMLSRAGKVIRP
jgi:selenium metabolism protein YedF